MGQVTHFQAGIDSPPENSPFVAIDESDRVEHSSIRRRFSFVSQAAVSAMTQTSSGHDPQAGPGAPDSVRGRLDATTVLIVDDHDEFRIALAEMLTRRGFDVVGDTADGGTALRLVEELAPTVVLMDLQMPRMHGIEVTRRIAEVSPATVVLVLTVSAQEGDVVEALMVGARGYVVKGSSPESLVAGIEASARGESMISAEVASKLFAQLRPASVQEAPDDSPTAFLSTRELEILRLLAAGRQNVDIARELVISPFTVRNHISNLLRKLQLENRTQAAAYAIRHGL
jgi:DNA-binding NarL/FixJ family response regulator